MEILMLECFKKKILVTLSLLIVVSSCSNTASVIKSGDTEWNDQKREHHLNNRNDPSAWDMDLHNDDIQNIEAGDYGPFESGVFPEPKYSLIGKGSFKGLGVIAEEFEVKGRTVLNRSFFVKENVLNKDRLGGRKDEVFFQVLVLTDTIDNVNYNLSHSVVVSRNHPDYLGQGFIKTKTNKIQFLAFTTPENETYAIINARIFNLRFGKTILIAPQKDKSLRSLQIESPQFSSDVITEYTKSLLEDEKVIKFFQNRNNI